MRAALVTAAAALVLAAPAAGTGWSPSADWLAQARCVHAKEGGWRANTGNGYFGGMQFSPATWTRVGGAAHPAFTHVGSGAFPFSVSPHEQLYRAWLLWRHDGRSWRSWGAIGASCTR
jgi:resuscitation-promoting factor RpfA